MTHGYWKNSPEMNIVPERWQLSRGALGRGDVKIFLHCKWMLSEHWIECDTFEDQQGEKNLQRYCLHEQFLLFQELGFIR